VETALTDSMISQRGCGDGGEAIKVLCKRLVQSLERIKWGLILFEHLREGGWWTIVLRVHFRGWSVARALGTIVRRSHG
jgi:hypothetical protein